MSIDSKRLRNFVKIVDAGSLSRAAGLLRVAQPALSQQIAALEADLRRQLLIRSKIGVVPTEAGRILYQHAQIILKQLERAELDVARASSTVSGHVSVGLATYGASGSLSIPLLKAISIRHPTVVLHINDSFGQVLSELIMSGRMDMAVIYGEGPIKGVTLQPLFKERLFLVSSPPGFSGDESAPLPLKKLDGVRLLAPGRTHFLRQIIDTSFGRACAKPRIVAEIESVATLSAAVRAGLGATILPYSAAAAISSANDLCLRALSRPTIEVTVSLCLSGHSPLSEAATVAKEILLEIVGEFVSSGHEGIRSL